MSGTERVENVKGQTIGEIATLVAGALGIPARRLGDFMIIATAMGPGRVPSFGAVSSIDSATERSDFLGHYLTSLIATLEEEETAEP